MVANTVVSPFRAPVAPKDQDRVVEGEFRHKVSQSGVKIRLDINFALFFCV